MSRSGARGEAAEPEGLILLDKPPGVSSFQALASVKRTLGTGRVGHTGTLDRAARGLLVVLSGRFTRLASLFAGQAKSYMARVLFGEETSTLDLEGEAVATAPIPDRAAILEALPRFVGEIEQVPPAYSAVHHDGERAYRLARRGEPPELAPRRVRVHAFDLLSYEPPFASLHVQCGAGTYVRSLARDLALACGSRATVAELVRTEVGPFQLAEAVAPAAFVLADMVAPSRFLPRLAEVASAVVEGAVAARVASGAVLRDSDFAPWPAGARMLALCGPDGSLLAVLERGGEGVPRYVAVFPPAGRRVD